MSVIGMRDLSRRTTSVVEEVQRTGEPAIVTRRGKPAVAVVPIDTLEWEDYVLSHADHFLERMKQADRDLADGRTRPYSELRKDLGLGEK